MNELRGTMLIAQRELGAYFNTAWGYVVIAALLLADGLLFNAYALGAGAQYSTDVLEKFFEFSSGVTMIAAIFLTIRLFAEERATGTMVLLDGAPIGNTAVVLGKFVSALVFLGGLVLFTAYMPLLILVNGKVSLGHIFAGYLGLIFLGATCVSMGAFASALTRNQVVAGVIGGVTLVTLILMWKLAQVSEPPFRDLFEYLSLWDRHFRPFMQGRIQSETLVYYTTVTTLFLLLTTRVQAWRRSQ